MMLALSNGVEIAWWVALGLGLLVAVVVWVLLEVLRRTVDSVRAAVDEVLSMGGRLAQNTATIHVLQATAARGNELIEELEKHRPGGRSEA